MGGVSANGQADRIRYSGLSWFKALRMMSVQEAKKFDTELDLKRAEHLGVLTYWQNKHQDARLPARRDIGPRHHVRHCPVLPSSR